MALRNDVGLLAEEYDPSGRRQFGNFPQARAINMALNLGNAKGPGRTALAPGRRDRACGGRSYVPSLISGFGFLPESL